MLELHVSGVNALGGLADRLRYAGRTDLMRELRTRIRAAGATVEPAVKTSAAATQPKRGGYAAVLSAALQTKTNVRTGARTAGVDVEVYAPGQTKRRDIRAINRGILRHPRFGDRTRWYTTNVTPGFFDAAAAEVKPLVVAEVRQAIEDVKQRALGRT